MSANFREQITLAYDPIRAFAIVFAFVPLQLGRDPGPSIAGKLHRWCVGSRRANPVPARYTTDEVLLVRPAMRFFLWFLQPVAEK